MNLNDITPLIIAYNEAPNIGRVLAALPWARQIVVVDSGSTDGTLELLAAHPDVWVFDRQFDNFAAQCNFGLANVTSEWTLSIDADYLCGAELEQEIGALDGSTSVYAASFVYAVLGRPLRGTLYPPRPVLFRTRHFQYSQDGHAHKLMLGEHRCEKLRTKFTHDDRKPLTRWLRAQASYATLEADKLLQASADQLGWKDRLRQGIVWAAPLTLLYCLFWKRLLLDGWPGVYYSLQRTYAELLLSLELLDRRLRGRDGGGPAEAGVGDLDSAADLRVREVNLATTKADLGVTDASAAESSPVAPPEAARS